VPIGIFPKLVKCDVIPRTYKQWLTTEKYMTARAKIRPIMFFSQNEDEEIQTNLSQLCGLARIKPM
jgi:hypothetical protein